MSTVIEVTAEDGDRQIRSPLLRSSLSAPDSVPTGDTGGLILTSTPSGDHNTQSPPPTRRLASLDVFRGLTVAVSCSFQMLVVHLIFSTERSCFVHCPSYVCRVAQSE